MPGLLREPEVGERALAAQVVTRRRVLSSQAKAWRLGLDAPAWSAAAVSRAAVAAVVVSRAEEAPASRVGPMKAAVIRGLNARIVGWMLTSSCVLAVWRRSG